MKLFEKLIYSVVLFVFIYVFVSMTLRLFEITTVYNSHIIGGIVATVLGTLMFMFLLLKKEEK